MFAGPRCVPKPWKGLYRTGFRFPVLNNKTFYLDNTLWSTKLVAPTLREWDKEKDDDLDNLNVHHFCSGRVSVPLEKLSVIIDNYI